MAKTSQTQHRSAVQVKKPAWCLFLLHYHLHHQARLLLNPPWALTAHSTPHLHYSFAVCFSIPIFRCAVFLYFPTTHKSQYVGVKQACSMFATSCFLDFCWSTCFIWVLFPWLPAVSVNYILYMNHGISLKSRWMRKITRYDYNSPELLDF